MKRSLSFGVWRRPALVASGTALIAVTYGLVRLAYGLFLPDVQGELGLETSVAGHVSSGASTMYCVGALVGFAAAGRHPRALVLAAGASAGAGAAGMAVAQHPTAFAVSAMVGSAGAGLASPAMVRIIDRHVAESTQERDQTRVNAGTGPGLVAAGVLALLLLPNWRLAWLLSAAIAVLVAAAVLALDRHRDRVATGAGSSPAPGRTWFAAHRHLVAAAFAMGAGSAAVWSFGRSLLVEAGADERTSVLAWVALGLGGAAVIGTARPMSRLGAPRAWAVASSAAGVASVALAFVPGSATVALGSCALFGWGFTAATGVLIAWTAAIDPDRAAAGTSLLFVVLVLGQAFGASFAGGLAARSGFGPAFVAAGVLMLAAAVMPWRSPRGSRAPSAVSVS